ncbi:hypothetical protein KIH74_08505 [Kineosporia sp. J2-2]|uniref:Uncharacterized protein n=1 Tax=Kineosporia corallincola TaxID=2835133 RepID=A0ABS5TD00_9ACTN|nr:hypothetical protein [Kineosporia corallincola]MBT0768964.1 hypothetical protein [Kineosporia corallincola]
MARRRRGGRFRAVLLGIFATIVVVSFGIEPALAVVGGVVVFLISLSFGPSRRSGYADGGGGSDSGDGGWGDGDGGNDGGGGDGGGGGGD